MGNTQIKIEKGVPKPARSVYPFESMRVGESFIAGESTKELSSRVSSAINYFCKKYPKQKFSQRTTEDNLLRVWRDQ